MRIKYADAERHLSKIKPALKSLLSTLEELIINGRDGEDVPVYLTKYRIKSPDSIFLKTKRKKITSLNEITDYAGMRLLCLFEKDILDVHEYLMKILHDNGYTLEEFKIYNWPKSLFTSQLQKTAKGYFKNLPLAKKLEEKESGYKSLHYIVKCRQGNRNYSVEIQLRTLLQDVWGELEHALSYKKGSIHPHIKKSFKLLARDLETNDILLSHLRDISEKEHCGDQFSHENIGPRTLFDYEPNLIPKLFRKNQELEEKYSDYWEFMKKVKITEKEEWIKTANEKYQVLHGAILSTQMDQKDIKYWMEMEKAFLLFCEAEYEKALDIYNNLVKEYPERYVVFFRQGEILFIRGMVEKALTSFDESERILLAHKYSSHYVNKYKIKLRLAYVYWWLGEEYIDIVVRLSQEAYKIFTDHEADFPKRENNTILNNLCWYLLEKHILDKQESSYKEADNTFKKLLKTFDPKSSSNACDTIAWFYYNKYLKSQNKKDLDAAQRFVKIMGNRPTYTSFNIRSLNIQMNHVQTILNAK